MGNTNSLRWQQRLDSFGRALSRLEEACRKESYTRLELAGLVKTFEFTYELGWKVLKDLLLYQGQQTGTPREAVRGGFDAHYLNEQDCEIFLDAMDRRNKLAHIYEQRIAQEVEALIKQKYYPMFCRLQQTLEQQRTS